MFKRLFQAQEAGAPVSETHQGKAPQDSIIHNNVEPVREMASMPPATGPNVTQFKSFEEIYGTVPSKLAGTYGILKVAAMTRSPHLTQMSAESKRAALLMALEAAGVDIEDVLQDAMLRQRALNSYEEAQCQRMQEFEEGKLRENANIQAELDRLTAQYMSRIQINLDAVAREQDALRAWQKRKQQEGQRIAEAAGFSVPPEAGAGSSLPAVVERIRSRPAAASGG